MRIPRKIFLPWGWEILVKQVSDKQMADDLGADDCDGLWDVDEKIIYIRKSQSLSNRVDTLGHEVIHAVNDWYTAASRRGSIYESSQKARKRLKAKKK